MTQVVAQLDVLPGAGHVVLADTGRAGVFLVTADVGARAADATLELLDRLGVPPDDIVVHRLDTIGPASAIVEPFSLVWAELVGQARLQSRAPARYFVFMAAAGVIAAFGVINQSPV